MAREFVTEASSWASSAAEAARGQLNVEAPGKFEVSDAASMLKQVG